MTDRFTHDAGPYVLGALPPEDRRAFEEHLATCGHCQAEVREFAGLPGLLSRLPAGELPAVLQGSAEPPPPVSVLPALLREAGVQRTSRRRRALGIGIAAALVVAAGTAVVTESVVDRPATVVAEPPAGPQSLSFTRASSDIPASAEATLTDVPGGTQIEMTCRYEGVVDGKDREYKLFLVKKDGGGPTWLATWPVLGTQDYKTSLVVPMPRDSIATLEIQNATGRPLLVLHP